MPKFIVTGGAGFIGSHLVDFLLQYGNEVIVIDNLSTGKISNIINSIDSIDYHCSSIENIDFKNFSNIDAVFHLAAQASVPISLCNFKESSSTNVLSSLKIIDFCASNQIPLIYASSSAVYGNNTIGLESGDVDLLSPYAVDKFISEIYCQMAHKVYNLRSYGLRFFNVYGPRQDCSNPYSGVISIFADRILNNKSIIINGGYQTRDFIYVSDVVNGIWKSYEFLLNNSVATISNLLSGNSISINELADILIGYTGNSVEKTFRQLQSSDPEKSLGSLHKMQIELELYEFIKLKDGLKHVINWLKSSNERA
jgi:UDP-glucose 4-epimerase